MKKLSTKDFNYHLPEELIAQTPIEPRDHSRLLVYHRATKKIEHRHFYNVTDYLGKDTVMVVNNTKVMPARLNGYKETGGTVELLLHKRINLTDWEVLIKPAKRISETTPILFASPKLKAHMVGLGEDGTRIVRFEFDGLFEEIIDEIGSMPLPHYIKGYNPKDKERYQTVYAKHDGSAAAPTAGLHFTPELMNKIKTGGTDIAEVLLHVGLGTFRPVKVDDVTKHKMHSEFYRVDEANAKLISGARKAGKKIVAVGTTSVRTLETVYDEYKDIVACDGDTEYFIYPPYEYKAVDALITNFHLPESTLIMLVAAFIGHKETMDLYNLAVKEKYRFFSYGDAMLLL
ncbi:MAG: tRNA preQ1(34) S-adenosylmethionine ribosyltransferase-isomerase QueA [Firmicutes bacterium]|nr:tRNA preQ1(34) S-adenosylmethionine ribosyltransferase-isomerase QueA [Bacillota bacterium]